MPTDIDDRVRALERAVTERDDPAGPIPDIADVNASAIDLDERVSDLESRVSDLAARQQAVEAYVDRIVHVNESIERRADAALAAVDRLETSGVRHSASTSAAELRPSKDDQGEQQSDPAAGESLASHVTDAARFGAATDQDEDADSGAEGLIARLVGL